MKEKPSFFYQYTVCEGRFFFNKDCKMHRDEYDITDQNIRKKLKDMGFVLKRTK